jgi:hypothetical protein
MAARTCGSDPSSLNAGMTTSMVSAESAGDGGA